MKTFRNPADQPEDPFGEAFDLFEDIRDRGPNYRECPQCQTAAMSQAALDQHIRLAHPDLDGAR